MRSIPGLDGISRILCLGAHPDDIEIGCGGTIHKVLESSGAPEIRFVVFSGDEQRAGEATHSAEGLLKGARASHVVVRAHRDGYFPYVGDEIKGYFDELGRSFAPDVVFTHHRDDLHQDHRLISELTWNTFRDHVILEYEIPKYDGDLGAPNTFVHLDREAADRKVSHLLGSFGSQREKPWFTEETFLALLRLRGVESRSPGGYAEAFYCRKLVLS